MSHFSSLISENSHPFLTRAQATVLHNLRSQGIEARDVAVIEPAVTPDDDTTPVDHEIARRHKYNLLHGNATAQLGVLPGTAGQFKPVNVGKSQKQLKQAGKPAVRPTIPVLQAIESLKKEVSCPSSL
jgi:hypothetical protein